MEEVTHMRVLKGCLAGFMILLALNFAACCTTKDEEKTVIQTGSSATLGEQLKDLKDAYDRGAINEKEYNDAKEKLLKQQEKKK
jgi:Short C-terminal domain